MTGIAFLPSLVLRMEALQEGQRLGGRHVCHTAVSCNCLPYGRKALGHEKKDSLLEITGIFFFHFLISLKNFPPIPIDRGGTLC